MLHKEAKIAQQCVDHLKIEQADEEKYLNECKEKYKIGYARKRRENTATTKTMINDSAGSCRYRRRDESRNVMEFLHGAIYGSWDLLVNIAPEKEMETLIISYKRGKFLENYMENFQTFYPKVQQVFTKPWQ